MHFLQAKVGSPPATLRCTKLDLIVVLIASNGPHYCLLQGMFSNTYFDYTDQTFLLLRLEKLAHHTTVYLHQKPKSINELVKQRAGVILQVSIS